LHPALASFISRKPHQIVNIGCAEGYYAVGLAWRLPNAKVDAFRSDPRAREFCAELARLNGVEARVRIYGLIETNTYYAHGLRESYTGTGTSGRDRFIYDGVNVLLEKLPGGTFAIHTQQPETPGGTLMISGPFRRPSEPQGGASGATMTIGCAADKGESP
jgi:hypothetical protein